MATPIVSWCDASNNTAANFNIGTVDAGSVSPDTTFLIWNNKAGETAVSDMTNCAITTKDTTGGNTGEVVTNTWMQVRVDSMSEATFSPIGGIVTKTISAAGAPSGEIKGLTNDGVEANSLLNHAKVTLHASVPQIATAGNFDFITRVSYQYV